MSERPTDVRERERNSYKLDENGEVCKIVCDDEAHRLLNDIITSLGGSNGTPIFDSKIDTTVTNGAKDLIAITVGAGKTRSLQTLKVSCRSRALFKITVAGATVGTVRTSPGDANPGFVFTNNFAVAPGVEYKVIVEQNLGAPSVACEVYLESLET